MEAYDGSIIEPSQAINFWKILTQIGFVRTTNSSCGQLLSNDQLTRYHIQSSDRRDIASRIRHTTLPIAKPETGHLSRGYLHRSADRKATAINKSRAGLRDNPLIHPSSFCQYHDVVLRLHQIGIPAPSAIRTATTTLSHHARGTTTTAINKLLPPDPRTTTHLLLFTNIALQQRRNDATTTHAISPPHLLLLILQQPTPHAPPTHTLPGNPNPTTRPSLIPIRTTHSFSPSLVPTTRYLRATSRTHLRALFVAAKPLLAPQHARTQRACVCGRRRQVRGRAS